MDQRKLAEIEPIEIYKNDLSKSQRSIDRYRSQNLMGNHPEYVPKQLESVFSNASSILLQLIQILDKSPKKENQESVR